MGRDGQVELLSTTVRLPAEPSSAGAARRVVRSLLEQADREQWVDAAVLAVSEIVTNVILHAHTAMELRVRIEDDGLVVEVQDGSLSLPQQRAYGAQATTGRGIELVAALSSDWGLRTLGDAGKFVWFRIDAEPAGAGAGLDQTWAEWDVTGVGPSHPPEDHALEVVLTALPPTLWLAAQEHHDALLRELALYRAEHPAAQGSASLSQADAARQLVGSALVGALQHAHELGTSSPVLPAGHPGDLPAVPSRLDLRLRIPVGAAEDFTQLQDALDEAEQLAVAERLLVSPGLPEVVAVRDWACEQVIAQSGGAPVTDWAGSGGEAFVDHGADEAWQAGLEWTDTVSASDRAQVAADSSNRIVAVSAPLCERLGWVPAALVGRRVVALVPHRFREAHVAGFTRHLSTGVSRVLGVPLELPVLHADGTESTALFVIDQVPTPGARRVYVATLTLPEPTSTPTPA